MIEITFIRQNLSPFEIKIAKKLKEKGYNVSAITFYQLKEEFRNVFDENIFWLKRKDATLNKFSKLLHFPIFLKRTQKKKNNILIGVTSTSNWFTSLIFFILHNKAKKRIYFPYDIAFFRYKDYKTYPWYVRWSEKYNFRNCDGIIHKGPKDELKHLPESFKALEKPSLQFLPYCDEDMMVEMDDEFFDRKLSKNDGKIHLVYVGGVYHNSPGHQNKIDVFKHIINQGIIVHVYPRNFDEIKNAIEYRELEETNLLIVHKPVYGRNFQKVISKYDWGFHIGHHDKSIINMIWPKIAFCNKISSYLEAGLPIVVCSNFEFISGLVNENKIGLVTGSPKKIKSMIEKQNYRKLTETVDTFREKFNLNYKINDLIKFITSTIFK